MNAGICCMQGTPNHRTSTNTNLLWIRLCLAQIEDLWTCFKISAQISSDIASPISFSHIILMESRCKRYIWLEIYELEPFNVWIGVSKLSRTESLGRWGKLGNVLWAKFCRNLKKCCLRSENLQYNSRFLGTDLCLLLWKELLIHHLQVKKKRRENATLSLQSISHN